MLRNDSAGILLLHESCKSQIVIPLNLGCILDRSNLLLHRRCHPHLHINNCYRNRNKIFGVLALVLQNWASNQDHLQDEINRRRILFPKSKNRARSWATKLTILSDRHSRPSGRFSSWWWQDDALSQSNIESESATQPQSHLKVSVWNSVSVFSVDSSYSTVESRHHKQE